FAYAGLPRPAVLAPTVEQATHSERRCLGARQGQRAGVLAESGAPEEDEANSLKTLEATARLFRPRFGDRPGDAAKLTASTASPSPRALVPLIHEGVRMTGSPPASEDHTRGADGASRIQSALLAAVDQAVVVTDPDGKIVTFNAAAAGLYGWDSVGATGERAERLVAPVSAQAAGQMRRQVKAGQSWRGELVLRRRDGEEFPGFVTATPVVDDRGTLLFVITLSSDISVQKESEQTAQTFFALVSSSADAIFTKSLEGTILTWNRGAERLYGFAADDVIGRHVSLLEPAAAHGEIDRLLRAVAVGETVQGLETVRRHRDGTNVDVSLTVSPIFDEQGAVAAASVIGRDIGDRRRLQEQLARHVTHDHLTGLPNRTLLEDRLAQAIARATRHGRPLALLLLDLNRFNDVNAARGYVAGDQVLVEVARRVQEGVGALDTVARLGGDGFVVLCEEATAAEAEELAERLAGVVAAPIQLDGSQVSVSVSIGIAVSPQDTAETDALLRYAQAAMYEAKLGGSRRWRTFEPSSQPRWNQRLELGQDLRRALGRQELEVHYQPVVHLATGRILGVEALVRWRHPSRGWVPPSLFVPLAEDDGLIGELDGWVLQQACRDAAYLIGCGLLPSDAYLAVNASARTVSDPALVERVLNAARRARFPLAALELEVTETGLIADRRAATQVLTSLREMGVGIALDDFGTGYASFTYLRHLPVSTIKIDRQFVQHLTSRREDFAITASVVDLGRAVGLRTVAEGVENTEQLSILHRLGCLAGQGFLWSPALVRDDLITKLRQQPAFHAAPITSEPTRLVRKDRAVVTNEHGLHLIQRLHRDGASLATIAAALNAEGYHSATNLRWHSSSVARVIADLADAAGSKGLSG
ncbi:MAG: hypothetical protein QOE58_1095, partial [Actinomycetota bacterium]|nr:hypothetical protein [Actinomycetota bacterium]